MDRSLNELLALIRLTEKVSAELHGLATEPEIFFAVIGAFRRSKRFKAHLIMEDQSTDMLRFVGTSFSPAAVRLGEVVAGVSIDTFRIDPEQSPLLHRVWNRGQTVQASTTEALADFLPSSVVPKILRRIGYERTHDILTPLRRGARIVGILSVTAPDLADYFVPSLQNLAHHIGAALDFADAQEARARTERQYQNLVENLNEVFFAVDVEGRLAYISPNVSRMGFEPDQLIGQPFTDVFTGAGRERIEARFHRYLRGELATGQADYPVRAEARPPRWIRISGRSIIEEGRVVGVHGSIADVTEERRTAEELRLNEERLALALEATSDGLWDWHIPSGQAYFSSRYYTMLGYEPGEFPANFEAWKSLLHPDDRPSVLRQLKDHIAHHDEGYEIESRLRAKDSSWRWILSRGRVIERDADGQPMRMIGTHVDITSRKEDATALERALTGTIRAVARTAEVRDPYTAGHQERVALLACAIAGEMGCPATTIAALRAAGLLHDVGKIAVPSEILSKPGQLTEIEMRLVREHVEAGYRILAEIAFPWPVARMVRQHHERLDGSGYPHGLAGEAICLEARILAVADVVESMSSHRPYRAAFGIEAALEELERNRDTAFDPDVVDACVRLFRDRGLTFETLPLDGLSPTD